MKTNQRKNKRKRETFKSHTNQLPHIKGSIIIVSGNRVIKFERKHVLSSLIVVVKSTR